MVFHANYDHHPNTVNTPNYHRTRNEIRKSAGKSLETVQPEKSKIIGGEDINVGAMAFKIYQFLCINAYNEYFKNIFDEKVSSKVLHHFSFASIDDDSLNLSLPYINSHKSLLCDLVDNDQLTTWAINAIWFLPKIVHYLFADTRNLPVLKMANNVTCQNFAV